MRSSTSNMDLSKHFIFSLLLSLLLYPFFGFVSLLIFVGGFLIDVDHYVYHMVRYKKINPLDAYRYCKSGREGSPQVLHIFHTYEVLLIIFILALFSEVMGIIVLGILLHIGMDLLDLLNGYMHRKEISITLRQFYQHCRAYSVLGWITRELKGRQYVTRDHM